MYNWGRNARSDSPVNTQVVANTNAGSFHPGELPGIECEPCYPSDVATWHDIYWAAFALRLQCVAGQQRFGWTSMGTRPSLYAISHRKSLPANIFRSPAVIANHPFLVRGNRYKAQHWHFRVGFRVIDGPTGAKRSPSNIANNSWAGKLEHIVRLEYCRGCTYAKVEIDLRDKELTVSAEMAKGKLGSMEET